MSKIVVNFASSLSKDDRDLIENYRGSDSTLGEIARSAYERRHLTARQRECLENPHRIRGPFIELGEPGEYWDDPMEHWVQDSYFGGSD